ncbi:MAG: hypothetical protein ACOY4Y_00960 [Pseudomonadota bacterium]
MTVNTSMNKLSVRTLLVAALSAAALSPAHAGDDPLWSLSIGVPGLVGSVGNVYPVAPQPVYVAPPVQYVPAPVYVYPAPVYGPRDRREWRRHYHGHRHEDDEGDH